MMKQNLNIENAFKLKDSIGVVDLFGSLIFSNNISIMLEVVASVYFNHNDKHIDNINIYINDKTFVIYISEKPSNKNDMMICKLEGFKEDILSKTFWMNNTRLLHIFKKEMLPVFENLEYYYDQPHTRFFLFRNTKLTKDNIISYKNTFVKALTEDKISQDGFLHLLMEYDLIDIACKIVNILFYNFKWNYELIFKYSEKYGYDSILLSRQLKKRTLMREQVKRDIFALEDSQRRILPNE